MGLFSPSSPQDKARACKERGSVLLGKGRLEAALKEFRGALAEVPDDVAARKKAGDVLARLGQKPGAIAEYQWLAGKYAATGQLVQAIAVGKLILQLDPAHRETQDTLARLYARRGERHGNWLEKVPASMAGALNLRHVAPAPQAAPAAPGEIEIEVLI